MITVRWISNFGNNMFQYAVLYAVSKETGLCRYSGNWTGHGNDTQPIGDGKILFNLPEDDVPSKGCICHRFNDKIDEQFFDPNIFKIRDETELYGYFQSDKYFIKYRSDIIGFYNFKDIRITDRAKQILKSINRPIIICCHSREGDYARPNSGFPVLNVQYFKKAIDLICQKGNYTYKEIGIVITSENKNTAVCDVATSLNIPYHLSHEDKFVDMSLMKYADHCVTSASSFSWWGTWLNQNNPIIISPKYWVNYYKKDCFYPRDIAMSIPNQFFIEYGD